MAGYHGRATEDLEATGKQPFRTRRGPPEVTIRRVGIGDVNGNSQIEAAGLFINRIEVAVGEQPIAL